jgi:hypothetical protein
MLLRQIDAGTAVFGGQRSGRASYERESSLPAE